MLQSKTEIDAFLYFCGMKAIISGASSGIGLAVARQLTKAGWQIAGSSRDLGRLKALREELNACSPTGNNPILVHADLSESDGMTRFLQEVDQHWDCPDLIFCNAGLFSPDFPSELTPEKLNQVFQVNVFMSMNLCNHWLGKMKAKRAGLLIFTGSIVTQHPRTAGASYSLSKLLLDDYAALLADELRDYSIRVSRVQPGSVDTATWGNEPVPRDLFVDPEDIAESIVWMTTLPAKTWVENLIIRPTDKNW